MANNIEVPPARITPAPQKRPDPVQSLTGRTSQEKNRRLRCRWSAGAEPRPLSRRRGSSAAPEDVVCGCEAARAFSSHDTVPIRAGARDQSDDESANRRGRDTGVAMLASGRWKCRQAITGERPGETHRSRHPYLRRSGGSRHEDTEYPRVSALRRSRYRDVRKKPQTGAAARKSASQAGRVCSFSREHLQRRSSACR